jgi:hypothetical protein
MKLGNGSKALFWTDRWLDRQSISDLAPQVFVDVSTRTSKIQKVATTLPRNAWIQDIATALSVDGTVQFRNLVEILDAQQTTPDSEDEIIWHLSASGEYSSQSAYKALFAGTMTSPHYSSIWECMAPLKCKVFAWLASMDRY